MDKIVEKIEKKKETVVESKIVQIATSITGTGLNILFALKDDGTLWSKTLSNNNQSEWVIVTPIQN
jgi:hypothetical protein